MKRFALIFIAISASLTAAAQGSGNAKTQRPDSTVTWKFTIREAKVSASRIEERGDTLQYGVGSFRQGQDRSIEDVIARMPGLEVGENGTIRYEGKAISKVYIEGMDLMGGGYAMATRNLPADKVRRVEVLRNHQSIRSLRGKSFSEQVALNIVLKDEVKNSWSGTADLGLGTGARVGKDRSVLVDSRLMAMLFARKSQNLSMYKANSTGADIGAETLDLAALVRGSQGEDGILGMDAVSTPDLAPERSRFNRSHLAAVNQLFLTPRQNNVRMQLNWLHDRTAMSELRQMHYTGLDGTAITEESNLYALTHRLKGELQYTVNNDRLYLDSRLRGYADWNASEGSTLLGGVETQRYVQPRKQYAQEDFQLIKPLSGSRKLELSSQTTYSHLPGRLLVLDGDLETLNINTLQTHNYAAYSHRLWKFNMEWRAGMRADCKHLGGSFDGRVDSFGAYFTPSLEFNRQWFKMKAALGLDYDAINRRADVAVLPSLTLSWTLSPGLDFKAGANRSRIGAPLTALIPAPIYTGYRTRTEGLAMPVHIISNSVYLGLDYANPVDGFFASVMATASLTQRNLLWETQLDGETFIRRATGQTYSAPMFNIRGSLSKSYSWASARFSLTPQISRNQFQNVVAGSVRNYKIENIVVPFSWSLNPARWISADGRHQLLATRMSETAIRAFNHSLRIFVIPASGWQIGWQSEIYHSNDKSVSFNHFGDLSLSCRAKRWEAGLRCNNIFDNSQYVRRSLSTIAGTVTSNPLRPREIILKLSIEL